MLLHEKEDIDSAVSVIQEAGARTFTGREIAVIEDAIQRVRGAILRVLNGPSCTIYEWGFCIYLADSGYIDELFSKIEPTGKVWNRYVQGIKSKCRKFLPRLKGLRKNMRADARRRLADALEEAGLALSNAHNMIEEDD